MVVTEMLFDILYMRVISNKIAVVTVNSLDLFDYIGNHQALKKSNVTCPLNVDDLKMDPDY
jgi:hypothetical protein